MVTGPLPIEPLVDGADDDEELVELPPPQAVASRPAVSRTAESAAPEVREIRERGRMRDPPSVSRRLACCRRVSGGGSRLAASQPRGGRLGKTNRRIARIARITAPARWPAPARPACARGEADLPDPHRDAARGPASRCGSGRSASPRAHAGRAGAGHLGGADMSAIRAIRRFVLPSRPPLGWLAAKRDPPPLSLI